MDWIPVTEELPNCESVVWVWSDELQTFSLAYYSKRLQVFVNPIRQKNLERCLDRIIPNVTFWKPLAFHYFQSPYIQE